MGSSRCRGGEDAPKARAARACTGYAGRIVEELGGFPTEPSIHLHRTVASRVPVHFQEFVLSLGFCRGQRCDVAEQLSRSVTQIRIKAARHFGVAWKLRRPLPSGRLLLR